MKNISSALRAELASPARMLCTLWRLQRVDARVYGFTDLDADIVYDDGKGLVRYVAAGFSPSAVDTNSDLSVANQTMNAILTSDLITEVDLLAGLWDGAKVAVYRVNPKDLSMGHEWINGGTIGEVTTGRNTFQAEVRGLAQALQQQRGNLVQPLCTAKFCDAKCGLNPAPFTFPGTVTAAGSNQSFGTDLTNPVAYFQKGLVEWITGANAGLSMDVKFFSGMPNYTTTTNTAVITDATITVVCPAGTTFARDYGVVDSDLLTYKLNDTPASAGDYSPGAGGVYSFNTADNGKTVTITFAVQDYTEGVAGKIDLQLEMPYAIEVGDTFAARKGCAGLIQSCKENNNARRFRGFPYLPGRDQLLSGKSS